MQLSARLLVLAATALCCFPTLFAFLASSPQCRCLTTTSSAIDTRRFQKIELLPPSANCRNTEILITLRNGKLVCVDPDVEWIKPVINKIVQRSKRRSESPVPTKTFP